MPSPPPGCGTSSETGSSLPASLTSGTSETCSPPTSTGTTAVTSSPASEDGITRSNSPAGQTDLFGRAHVPASPSAAPAKARASTIPVISGRRGFGSSESASLQWSLESRLRQRMALHGSTLFRLTWKRRITPSGRRISALRASALRTSDSGCGSWQSPRARGDAGGGRAERGQIWNLEDQARLAAWVTPDSYSASRGGAQDPSKRREGRHQINLQDQVRLASWPTPRHQDSKHGAATDYELANRMEVHPQLHMVATLAAWPTPMAQNPEGGSCDFSRTVEMAMGLRESVNGPKCSGSPAETAKPGQLNPAFSLWLMGYPTEWARCAAQVTRLSRRSRPSSSEPT